MYKCTLIVDTQMWALYCGCMLSALGPVIPVKVPSFGESNRLGLHHEINGFLGALTTISVVHAGFATILETKSSTLLLLSCTVCGVGIVVHVIGTEYCTVIVSRLM